MINFLETNKMNVSITTKQTNKSSKYQNNIATALYLGLFLRNILGWI